MAVLAPLYINATPYDAEAERRGLAGLVVQATAGSARGGVLGPAPSITLSGSDLRVGAFNGVVASGKGGYLVALDATTSAGTLGVADATNPRLDRVILEVLDPDNGSGGTERRGRVRIVSGTPAALPGLPALPPLSLHLGQVQVPKSGAGNPVITVDCPLTAASGAPVPVRSVADRATLNPRPGDQVVRLDAGGVIQTWDGSTWEDAAIPAVGSAWVLSGLLTKRRSPLGNQVSAGFMCTYPAAAGGFAITADFKKAMTLNNPGFLPKGDVFGQMLVLSPGNVTRADGTFNINSVGEIWIRTLSVQYTIQPGDKFYISANWSA